MCASRDRPTQRFFLSCHETDNERARVITMATKAYGGRETTTERNDGTSGLIDRVGGGRMLAFYSVVAVGIALQLVIFGIGLAAPLFGWFEPTLVGSVHFVHDMAFMSLMLAAFVGLTVQFYRPLGQIAGLQQVLLLFAIFLVGIVVMGTTVDARLFSEVPFFLLIFGPAVVAALLHPAGRALVRTRTAGTFTPLLAGLAVVAAIPLAVFAADQVVLQGSGDEHAVISHYAGMVIYAAAIVGFGLLASLKPAGWRVPLYSAAGLALILGVASVLYPNMVSSVGTMWGGAAILWAAAFAVAGELTARRGDAMPDIADETEPRMG